MLSLLWVCKFKDWVLVPSVYVMEARIGFWGTITYKDAVNGTAAFLSHPLKYTFATEPGLYTRPTPYRETL